jgi:hypothetical protein
VTTTLAYILAVLAVLALLASGVIPLLLAIGASVSVAVAYVLADYWRILRDR